METSLSDRIKSYQDLSDLQLMKRLPIVIILNIRSCSKLTSLLEKPFCLGFAEIMISVMARLHQEIDGVVFSYTYNDQIIITIMNDQESNSDHWYNNKVQNIVSAVSSIATLEFNRAKNNKNVELLGDAIFLSKVFVVPNIMELTNTMIYLQQNCFNKALSEAVFYELLKAYPSDTVKQMLAGKNQKQKSEILLNESKIDFNSYPIAYKRGVAAYRAPKLNHKNNTVKNKIVINDELPLFAQNKDWIFNIFKDGADILRIDGN